MKYLVIILSLFVSMNLNSQTVNGISITELEEEYVRIVCTSTPFKESYKVLLDYGQANLGFQKGHRILDEDGNTIKFNTIISALNFMYKIGFEFVENDRYEHVNYILLQNNNN